MIFVVDDLLPHLEQKNLMVLYPFHLDLQLALSGGNCDI